MRLFIYAVNGIKIRLAYAMSIHKSQGSEFPVVILPITSSSHRMLQRNLIYTRGYHPCQEQIDSSWVKESAFALLSKTLTQLAIPI